MLTPESGWKSSEHAHTAVASTAGLALAYDLISKGHVWPAVTVFFGSVLVTLLYTAKRSALKGLAMSDAIATVAAAGTSNTIADIIDSVAAPQIEKIADAAKPKIKSLLVDIGIADAEAQGYADNISAAVSAFAVEAVDVGIALVIAKFVGKTSVSTSARVVAAK